MTAFTAVRPGVRGVAATILIVEITIHLYLAPGHLHDVPYIGVLFVGGAVLLALSLPGVLLGAGRNAAWLLGAAVCAGMAVAFVVSRLWGLPGYHEAWLSDDGLGVLSLPPEFGFLLCAHRAYWAA